MQRSSRRRLASSFAFAVAFACGMAHADILKVAPKDALAVLKVNHLAATNKKASDLLAKLGVAAMAPAAADPLGAIKTKLGIKGGLNEDGDAGVIILGVDAWNKDPALQNDPANAPAVVLLPVSDFKAFLASFEGATTEGDVTSFQKDGKTMYAAHWGDYAALSPNKAAVAKAGDGLTLNASAAKEFQGKDVVLWANVPALKGALVPQMEAHKQQFLDMTEEGLKNNPQAATMAPFVKAFSSQLFAAAETFLNEANGSTASLNLSDAGINLAFESEFAPGSYLGKWVAAAGSDSSGSHTAGLPAGPYIFYGGSSLNGAALSQLVTDFAGPMLKEIAGGGDANATKIVDAAKKMLGSAKETNFGMLAPRGAIGAESLVQLAYVVKGDAKGFADGMKDYAMAAQQTFGGAAANPIMPFNFEYKAAGKTIDGVSFDLLKMALKDPKTPQDAQMAQGVAMVYGPDGLGYQIGAIDSTTAVMGMCLSDANLSKLVASAKSGTDDLAKMPTVMATTKALPAHPTVEFYFALDEAIRTGVSYAKQFGVPANIQLPDSLPPIGFAGVASGTTLRNEAHIPTELVQSLVAAYFQMMMGGGGNGGL